MKKRLLYVITGIILTLLLADTQPPISIATQSSCQLFKETGKSICGKFLDYWNGHGGLPQQGFPISDEIQEVSDTNGKIYTVQYFERAVFELHPENAGTPYEVLLTLLGSQRYLEYYGPDGAPNQRPSADNPRFFPETKRTIGGVFRRYWEQHGGLMQQGYPISDEFEETSVLDGKTYKVQYFERAAFELHPENAGTPHEVLLTQLGRYSYRSRYGSLILPDPVAPELVRRNEQASDRYFMWSEARRIQDDWHHAPPTFIPVVTRAFDLTTQRLVTVTDAPDVEEYSAISGSITVGTRKSTNPTCSLCGRDVIAKDLSTGATYTLATGQGFRYSPQVAGRTVAWMEHDPQTFRIVSKNIDTGAVVVPFSRPLGTRIVIAYQLSEQYIVLSEFTSGPPSYIDVQAYRFRDGQTQRVAHYIGSLLNIRLSGRYLVWQEEALHLTDLDTGKTTLLAERSTNRLAIRGDTILWTVHDPAGQSPSASLIVGMKQSQVQPLGLFSPATYQPPLWIAGDWLIWKESNTYKAITVAQAFRNAKSLETKPPDNSPPLVQASLRSRVVGANGSLFWLGVGAANRVYRYDLATRSKTVLYDSPGQKLTLATDGRSLIWIEFSPDARYRIRHYDISTSQVSTVVQTTSADHNYGPISPDIGQTTRPYVAVDAGVLYYQHTDPSHRGLWARTLANGEEQLVSPVGIGPVAADGKLLWLEEKPGFGSILHLRTFSPPGDIVLTNEQSYYVIEYAVGGDNVLWRAWSGGTNSLNRYNISTNSKTNVRTLYGDHRAIVTHLVMQRNTAIWTEERVIGGETRWYIVSLNLATGATRLVRGDEARIRIESRAMPNEQTIAFYRQSYTISDLFIAYLP